MDLRTLQALINTLNRIPVTGKDYMGMMIGCIAVLENEAKRQQEVENGKDHPAEGRE
jgi:hypothetical protein